MVIGVDAQEKLRKVVQPPSYIYPDTPVSVGINFDGKAIAQKEVYAGPDWLRKLGLEITNISGKDIRFIRVNLVLREATPEAKRASKPAPETVSVVLTLEFPSQPEIQILANRGSITLRPGISAVDYWTETVRKQGMQDIETVTLDIVRVGFTDGTSWVRGHVYRKDGDTEVPIKSPPPLAMDSSSPFFSAILAPSILWGFFFWFRPPSRD